MQIRIVDNSEQKTASVLASAIQEALDIRIAVAFVSVDGLKQIMPAVRTAMNKGGNIEFLVGLDTRVTHPNAIKEMFDLTCETSRASLFCFSSQKNSPFYHPKLYLMQKSQIACAIIGSSNLTKKGLTSNIEVNLFVEDDIHSEIISDIYSTYMKLKFHHDRVIPDEEYINLYAELYKSENLEAKRLEKDSSLTALKEDFINKGNELQRPKFTRKDLVGWLELVYDSLPEGDFTNQDIYQHEDKFGEIFPQNQNIRAKIRQQLQFLEDLELIEHKARGIWRKKP